VISMGGCKDTGCDAATQDCVRVPQLLVEIACIYSFGYCTGMYRMYPGRKKSRIIKVVA
jgi:hypothetical protein